MNVSRSQIDLYLVWLLSKGKNWLIVDPQIVLDYQNSEELATIETEWGAMVAPSRGVSAYLAEGVLGVGYAFGWIDASIGYRYLYWNFEDAALIDNISFNGPYAAAVFHF